MQKKRELLVTTAEALEISKHTPIMRLFFLTDIYEAADRQERKSAMYDAKWVRVRALSAAYTAGYMQAKREARRAMNGGKRE